MGKALGRPEPLGKRDWPDGVYIGECEVCKEGFLGVEEKPYCKECATDPLAKGWKTWAVATLAYQAYTLWKGSPLTSLVRKYVVSTPQGSAALGFVLAWIPYHWLFDPGPGLGLMDPLVGVFGAFLGLLGWRWRNG